MACLFKSFTENDLTHCDVTVFVIHYFSVDLCSFLHFIAADHSFEYFHHKISSFTVITCIFFLNFLEQYDFFCYICIILIFFTIYYLPDYLSREISSDLMELHQNTKYL